MLSRPAALCLWDKQVKQIKASLSTEQWERNPTNLQIRVLWWCFCSKWEAIGFCGRQTTVQILVLVLISVCSWKCQQISVYTDEEWLALCNCGVIWILGRYALVCKYNPDTYRLYVHILESLLIYAPNDWVRLFLKNNTNFVWSPLSTTILLTCISKEVAFL